MEVHLRGVEPKPADMPGFWEDFLPLQGYYLALFSILERYTAFAFGPTLDTGERLRLIESDDRAQEAVQLADPPAIKVFDTRDGNGKSVPGPRPFDAWYQVRNNLSHRGKAGFQDFELLERSVVGLHDTLSILLKMLPTRDGSVSAEALRLRPEYVRRRRIS